MTGTTTAVATTYTTSAATRERTSPPRRCSYRTRLVAPFRRRCGPTRATAQVRRQHHVHHRRGDHCTHGRRPQRHQRQGQPVAAVQLTAHLPGVPAVVTTGGYTGNVYHEFSGLLVVLFITSQWFAVEVVFVVRETWSTTTGGSAVRAPTTTTQWIASSIRFAVAYPHCLCLIDRVLCSTYIFEEIELDLPSNAVPPHGRACTS
jgi:hypothetical protein